MQQLKEDTLRVMELLNRDMPDKGLNQYETLRRMVREDERLKKAYRGVVNPGKVVNNAIQVFVKRAAAEQGVQGGTRLDDVLAGASPQNVLDEIVKDILPAVITSHVQGYMKDELTRLR